MKRPYSIIYNGFEMLSENGYDTKLFDAEIVRVKQIVAAAERDDVGRFVIINSEPNGEDTLLGLFRLRVDFTGRKITLTLISFKSMGRHSVNSYEVLVMMAIGGAYKCQFSNIFHPENADLTTRLIRELKLGRMPANYIKYQKLLIPSKN